MFEEIKAKVQEKGEQAKKWGEKKKNEVTETVKKYPFIVKPILIATGTILVGIFKTVNSIQEGKTNKCKVESDISGLDYIVKHPMTNQEILELDQKMADGERKGEALDDMELLKKERRRK